MMKKFLLFLLSVVFSLNLFSQKWETKVLGENPVTKEVVKEYVYSCSTNKVDVTIHISPLFNNVILIETSIPFGKFRISPFRHTITSKATVKLYNKYGEKIGRSSEKVGLGTLNTNHARKFGTIKNNSLYEHLIENDGYAVISYRSLLDNTDIDVVIYCLNNEIYTKN